LENIATIVQSIERQKIPGIFVEAGVALGGSAILIARLKSPTRPFSLFDVFGMIPPPSARDEQDAHARYQDIASGTSDGLRGDKYYGYEDDLYSKVRRNLVENGVDLDRDRVTLVKGLFEDTLDVQEPVAFAHIDCDWYDSVKVCIERITPQLSPDGILVFDDYQSYSGCRRAVDEFLAAGRDFSVVTVNRSITIKKAR
jgi:asparagine synthase (glutamine-hydrolysing)